MYNKTGEQKYFFPVFYFSSLFPLFFPFFFSAILPSKFFPVFNFLMGGNGQIYIPEVKRHILGVSLCLRLF